MKKTIFKPINLIIAASLCGAATLTTIAQDKPPPVTIDRDALAARGEILTNEDPVAIELRQRFASYPTAFHIGMAIAEGNTLPGSGKDRICASLTGREPRPCAVAVLYSVERNRNAVLLSRGAVIAGSDPIAAQMRDATRDIFFRMGFEIGLAAAGGDTVPGPGKNAIRDSLAPELRGGFSDAVTYMLERNRRDAATGATSGTTAGPAEKAAPPVASNEIRCRGYSRTGGREYVFFIINSRPSTTGETIVTYEMAFAPGTRAAGVRGEGLQPGDCAWVDRPINYPHGPFRIRFETVANAQLKQKLSGGRIDRSSTAAESYPDVETIPIYLKGENHYWSFGGITNEGFYFTATGNGYWKPAVSVGEVPQSPTEPARRRRTIYPTKP